MADYTEAQLERAREYLRRRIENEVSMEKDVHDLLSEYAVLLISAILSGATQEDIDDIVDMLVSELMEDIETLAVDEHDDDRDNIIAFIRRKRDGETIEDKVRKRAYTFVDELSTVVAAAVLLKQNDQTILSSIVGSLKEPWRNPILIAAREKARRGEITVPKGVDLEERHYGKGVPVSSETALTDLSVFAIAEGWGIYDYRTNRATARGYYVLRGSSLPCEICDSYVGYHPIEDEEGLPLYHGHCKCMVVWV